MLYVDVKYANIITPKFRNNKKKDDYLWNFSCPICGDSKKNTLKARCYIYRKKTGLFVRCHNCQYSTNIGNFIKTVDENLYKEYVLETYKEGAAPRSSHNKLDDVVPEFFKTPIIDSVLNKLTPVSNLDQHHKAVQYLISRQIPKDKYNLFYYTEHFVKFVNEFLPNKLSCLEHERLVIPFLNSHGKCFAITGRALNDEKPKYLNFKLHDDDLIYGLERIDFSKKIFVVEGPIDSLFLDNCIAVSGSSFHSQTIQSIKSNCVLVYDNEPRSKEITKAMEKSIDEGYSVCIFPDTVKQKDINDMILGGMSTADITKIICENIYSGIGATLKLNLWKRCV